MPISYLRALTDRERNKSANYHLASYLAFIAGATNAGGFLAVHQYTSHMSGIVSSMADQLVLSQFVLVLDGLGALLSFVTGAACTAILVNWARRKGLKSEYALPLEPIPVGNGLAPVSLGLPAGVAGPLCGWPHGGSGVGASKPRDTGARPFPTGIGS